jgi:hypothetical protein
MKKTFFSIVFFLYCANAFAYIGPGLGSGVIASVLGIFFAIVMLVIGVVWYPIKKIIFKSKSK